MKKEGRLHVVSYTCKFVYVYLVIVLSPFLNLCRDINPHIPQYISQAPWYVSLGRPSLKHQRPQDERQKEFSTINEWYQKGVKEGPKVTKYRKGACENCGAMTHKKKDCLEVCVCV